VVNTKGTKVNNCRMTEVSSPVWPNNLQPVELAKVPSIWKVRLPLGHVGLKNLMLSTQAQRVIFFCTLLLSACKDNIPKWNENTGAQLSSHVLNGNTHHSFYQVFP
jgi:hypothetical protein